METAVTLFENKKIRRQMHRGEWYFSILDFIEKLDVDSNPSRYWSELKIQLTETESFELFGGVEQLKFPTAGGKTGLMDAANFETIFRIMQSIPSVKTERFKQWQAQAACERIRSEYKKHKGLERENLRDHMTDLELIFSMLGEAATKEIAVNRDAQGFEENERAAKAGDKIAGNARHQLEQESGFSGKLCGKIVCCAGRTGVDGGG